MLRITLSEIEGNIESERVVCITSFKALKLYPVGFFVLQPPNVLMAIVRLCYRSFLPGLRFRVLESDVVASLLRMHYMHRHLGSKNAIMFQNGLEATFGGLGKPILYCLRRFVEPV